MDNENEPLRIIEQAKSKWSRNDKVPNRISPDFTIQNVQDYQDTKQQNQNSMGGLFNHQQHLVSTSTFGNVNEVYKSQGLNSSNSNFGNNLIIEEKQSLDSYQEFEDPPFDTNNLNSKQLSVGNYLKSMHSGNNGTLMQTLTSNYEPELKEHINSNQQRNEEKLKEKIYEQYKKELQQIKENKRVRYHSNSYNQQQEEKSEYFPLKPNKEHQHK